MGTTPKEQAGPHKGSFTQNRAQTIRQLRPIFQLAVACLIALLLSQSAVPRIVSGIFRSRASSTRGDGRLAQVIVTRSGQDARSDVWLSLLQALSRVRHLRTTILDTPLQLDDSQKMGRDSSLEGLAESLVWTHKPRTYTMDNEASTEDWMQWLRGDTKVLLTTSCATDLVERTNLYTQLLEKTSIILYCTVHDAEPFLPTGNLSTALTPWADQSRLHYISSSDHIGQLLANDWEAQVPSMTPRIFPPIFNVSTEALNFNEVQMDIQLRLNNGNITITEDPISSTRLTTDHTIMNQALERFSAARDFVTAEKHRVASVKVAGLAGSSDSIKKPSALQEENFRRQSNPSIMSTLEAFASSAMVVTVASQEHLKSLSTNKSSSIIPMAITAGVPPLVDEETLAAHAYLDRDAAIILSAGDVKRLQDKRGGNSTDSFDMMRAFEYFAVPYFQQYRKRHAVETLRTTLLVQNTHKLQAWILADTARGSSSPS